jgi:hypothetical protein
MQELPVTDISQLFFHPLFTIEKGGDKSIEDAVIIIERRLQIGERWDIILLHREKGMLLLKSDVQSGQFAGLWLKSPTCGDDSQSARMTSYVLGRIGVNPTGELHENLVSKYQSILIKNPGDKSVVCEAIE